MFFFSMFEDGPRGLSGPRQDGGDQEESGELEGGEDVSLYGVDWEVMDDEALMEHHYQHNPVQGGNPFSTTPATLSEVKCTPPDCPLPAESVIQLDHHLVQFVDINSRSMLVRRTIWLQAIHACSQIL
jgi:hypothetical protein